jgi:cell division septation protein DedD
MADEGVHEIQLNGKQLVFMFMAVTVVAVVIFLCGVMVGRGVRAPHVTEAANAPAEPQADPTVLVQSSPLTPDSTAPGTATSGASLPTATPVEENLSHSGSLSAATPPQETLREQQTQREGIVKNLSAPERAPLDLPAPKKAELKSAKAEPKVEPLKADATKTAQKAAEQARAEAKLAAKPVAAESAAGGAGNGFVVQVAAVKARTEADSIAKRLSSKGFPSYVTTPGPGAARVFRVRVGKYTDRREAESVARRLEKEEQFKPWITR